MAQSIPAVSKPEYPTNIVNKYAGNRLLAALPEKVLSLLEPDLRQVSLRQGAACYGSGDPINEVYFPQTGMISLLVTTSDGVRFATNSVGRYGAVGLQCGNGPRRALARAIVQIGGDFGSFRHRVSKLPPTAAQSCVSLYSPIPRGYGRKPSKTPLATRSTMARRGCAAGCCKVPTEQAVDSSS